VIQGGQAAAPAVHLGSQTLMQRYGALLIAGVILIVAPVVSPIFGAGPDLLSRVLIWGLFGLGFDLLFGYTGLLSFGQAAFYGTGSFLTAYLLTAGLIDIMLLALLCPILGASILGVMIGYLSLRRSG